MDTRHLKNIAFSVILVMILSTCMITTPFTVFSETTPDRSEVSEVSDDLIDIQRGSDRFYYNDKMLLDNIGETTPSGELSIASVELASAAYDLNTVKATLSQMGYSTIYESDYYSKASTRDDNDVVAYSIAEKYVTHNGETYRLVAVPVRGTTASCEWYSNFNVGLSTQIITMV